jgi:hypothetical protein
MVKMNQMAFLSATETKIQWKRLASTGNTLLKASRAWQSVVGMDGAVLAQNAFLSLLH